MFEDAIRDMLDAYSLEELFEEMDITPEEVLTILLEGGHVTIIESFRRNYEFR